MHVLLIGGTRFLGAELCWRLLAQRHRVTLLTRGTLRDPFGARVERLVADRTTDSFDAALSGRSFDACVDFAAYTGADIARAVRVLKGHIGHYIFISSGQVYLVRRGYTFPAREADYEGELIDEPAEIGEQGEWRYGIEKRAAEDALAAAWEREGFPSTRLRLPMVDGPRDHYRRIEGYLWRMLDGGPLLVPEGDTAPARHVYSRAVGRAIAELLGQQRTHGQAYNLAQDEVTTVRELLELISSAAGLAKLPAVPISRDRLAAAGLAVPDLSPFSSTWMSCLDPTKAKLELGFRHEALSEYIPAIVQSILSNWPDSIPPGYARRADELRLAGEG